MSKLKTALGSRPFRDAANLLRQENRSLPSRHDPLGMRPSELNGQIIMRELEEFQRNEERREQWRLRMAIRESLILKRAYLVYIPRHIVDDEHIVEANTLMESPSAVAMPEWQGRDFDSVGRHVGAIGLPWTKADAEDRDQRPGFEYSRRSTRTRLAELKGPPRRNHFRTVMAIDIGFSDNFTRVPIMIQPTDSPPA